MGDLMTIHLYPTVEKHLEHLVAAGHFATIDEAMSEAVERLVGEVQHFEAFREHVRAAEERGGLITPEELLADMESWFDDLDGE